MDIPSIGNAPPITPVRRVESAPQQERPQQARSEEEERQRPRPPEANRGQNVDILA